MTESEAKPESKPDTLDDQVIATSRKLGYTEPEIAMILNGLTEAEKQEYVAATTGDDKKHVLCKLRERQKQAKQHCLHV